MNLDAWWAEGRRSGDLFVHDAGDGPLVTLLHGYPGSSHDFHAVVEGLGDLRTLAPDLLGFGASAKPRDHTYSIGEQADLVEALWREVGMTSTVLVAHDYSTSVAQELLRRGTPGIAAVVLLNGAVYPHLHRPTEGQQLLLRPDGRELAAFIDEAMFTSALRETFASAAEDELHEMWVAMSRDDGQLLAADLLHYVADRKVHGADWVAAMETTALPAYFVWGLEDPVSGAHMIEEVRRRVPHADVRALTGVSHWPPLEAPADVVRAIRDALAAVTA